MQFNKDHITSILNHPGTRTLKTISELNQCSKDDILYSVDVYMDACSSQMKFYASVEDIAEGQVNLAKVHSAYNKMLDFSKRS